MEGLEVVIKMHRGRTTIVEVDSESPIKHVKVHLKSKIRIFVEITCDKIIPFKVDSTQTVGSLKAMILKTESISAGNIVLSYENKELDDSLTLADYDVHEDSTLVIRSKGDLQIYIKTSKGKTIVLNVNISDTIGKIKRIIEDQERIPLDKQRLIFDEKELEDSLTLAECNVPNESILDLVLQLRKTFQIFVKGLTGMTYIIEVKHSDTIRVVKLKIQDKVGYLPNSLLFDGIRLDDEHIVADYGIQKDSNLLFLPIIRG